MEDQSHANGTNVPSGGNPESPSLKSTQNSNNKEQDRFLPIANVGRIMKKVIPGNGKISKDAKETVQECVSEFISFVTGEASDKCQREKRKTINGDDIIWAITTLGFEDYVAPLQLYLNKYRDTEDEKINVPKQQRIQQQEQQEQSMSFSGVYSPTSIVSPASFVPTPQDHQQFSLPFSPSSYPKPLQQRDQIDSMGHW